MEQTNIETDDLHPGRIRNGNSGTGSSSRTHSKRNANDSQSAGRKVAAREFPLIEGAPCEWLGKANCGGGDYPILGCLDGTQKARHHGPEKDVSNNQPGNVHRICHYCHNRWHAKNDPTYDWNAGVWKAHDPRLLTPKEQREVAVDVMRYLSTGRNRNKLQELD